MINANREKRICQLSSTPCTKTRPTDAGVQAGKYSVQKRRQVKYLILAVGTNAASGKKQKTKTTHTHRIQLPEKKKTKKEKKKEACCVPQIYQFSFLMKMHPNLNILN